MSPELPAMNDRLLRLPEVKRRVGLGRSTIYRRMRDGTFPTARDLGGGVIAWSEAEVSEWIASRPRQPSPQVQA